MNPEAVSSRPRGIKVVEMRNKFPKSAIDSTGDKDPTTAATLTAGTHFTVSTAQEPEMESNHMQCGSSTSNTSASVAGSSRDLKISELVVHEGDGSSKVESGLHSSSSPGTAAELCLNELFVNNFESHRYHAKQMYLKATMSDERIAGMAQQVTEKGIISKKAVPSLDFESLISALGDFIHEYRQEVSFFADKLKSIDDERNLWLENTYILDSARVTNNFHSMKKIIESHEAHIESTRSEFLKSLNSIRTILGVSERMGAF